MLIGLAAEVAKKFDVTPFLSFIIMKHIVRFTLTLLVASFAMSSNAQNALFGYLSYDSILHSMADYATAQERIKILREQYNKEAEYNEDKFYKMYADYIQGQKTFPQEIMLKRQNELQIAMEQGITFRKDAEKMLQNAEADLIKPLEAKLDKAIAQVAQHYDLSFIVNTDNKSYPYINPSRGIDITPMVQLALAGQPLPTASSVATAGSGIPAGGGATPAGGGGATNAPSGGPNNTNSVPATTNSAPSTTSGNPNTLEELLAPAPSVGE